MKEIVKEALSRANEEKKEIEVEEVEMKEYETRRDDLEKILAGLTTNIKVFGCGGAGTNTIERCTEEKIHGAELIAINTDAQHLLAARVPHKILIGRHLTRGLGSGSLPQIGREAAMESEDDLRSAIQGADLSFITCGLGGGTGTGSSPVISKMSRDDGALTLGIVTLPFGVEGAIRMENAEVGLASLRETCDTVIVIPNDKLLDMVPKIPINAAFKVADEILMRSIKGITEMITKPGLINLDFADLKTIMKHGGVAMIGLGESDGEERSIEAVSEALSSPLLDVDVSEAEGALVNVIGGEDMTMKEAEGVVEEVYSRINPDSRIIWGTAIDPSIGRTIRTLIILTGVKSKQILGPMKGEIREAYGIDVVR